jgi:hypothetical protein
MSDALKPKRRQRFNAWECDNEPPANTYHGGACHDRGVSSAYAGSRPS